MTLDQRRLATLFWIAWNNRHASWHCTRLDGGLRVYLRVLPGAVVMLFVRREQANATRNDWERVLDNYGYPLPIKRPEPTWRTKARGWLAMWEHPAATYTREQLNLPAPALPVMQDE